MLGNFQFLQELVRVFLVFLFFFEIHLQENGTRFENFGKTLLGGSQNVDSHTFHTNGFSKVIFTNQ
jgi:hypothetical protein